MNKLRAFAPLLLLYGWWLLLGGEYLRGYWLHPMVGGADGSGHVAVLHLYAAHVYPDIQGWIPEFFGGMPFPVYYPPLFYWLGATFMKVGAVDAATAARTLTTLSFALLPASLFYLARKHGLSRTEATVAVGWAGVVACGSNAASLGGIGLLGLFEVGLYTQTLGFVWFCLWCGALPDAPRSRTSALVAILSLAALILTNVHILPLAAFFGVSWWAFGAWRVYKENATRRVRALTLHTVKSSSWLIAPLLVSAVWLIPLVAWYSYSIGEPLTAPRLLAVLGPLNLIWLACGLVAWWERGRRPALATLCVALILAAVAALSPLGSALPNIPLQAWRVMSSAVIVCTLPLSVLVIRSLGEVFRGQPWVIRGFLALSMFALAGIHPRQQLSISSLPASDEAKINRIRAAFSQLPPGEVLVEVVHPEAVFNSKAVATHDLAESRALTNRLAMDGRPVLWCVFREHAVTAPLSIAVSNLLSTTQEHFGIDGVALRRSFSGETDTETALRLARHLGVSFFLLKTEEQVRRLNESSSVRFLWTLDGWSLFARNIPAPVSFEAVDAPPVLAWVPARFKSRLPNIPDLFNIGEELTFNGRPDICVMWAPSSGTESWQLLSELTAATVIINPESLDPYNDWHHQLRDNASKLKVILLDDGSRSADEIDRLKENFAGYSRIRIPDGQPSETTLAEIARQVINFQQPAIPSSKRLWRTSQTYFPAWQSAQGKGLWLTGQGGMTTFGDAPPSLEWHSPWWRPASVVLSIVGLLLTALLASPHRQ